MEVAEVSVVWVCSGVGVAAGFRSFFLRFLGLMIRGRQVSDEDEDAEELVVPELGQLSSLATEWVSTAWDICACPIAWTIFRWCR